MQTEATIKIWVDGERFVRTAEGNGPVHALDKALRDAIGETYPHLRDIELVNFKVRILDETKGTGAVTRVLLDASDGHDTWGAIGVSENIIEASWDALVDSLEAGMLPGPRRARRRACAERRMTRRAHPARAPADRRAREGAGGRDAALAACSPSGPRLAEFEAALSERAGRRARVGGLQRHRGAAPGDPRLRASSAATRWSPRPFSFVASANCLLYEGAEPVFCDIDPRTLNIDPAAAAAAVDDRTTGLLPVHIFGYPADMPAFEKLAADRGLWIVEDACEALGAVHARRRAGGRARQPRHLRLLPQQAAVDGGGRRAGVALGGGQGARGQRAQPGPRARHGLARPRPPRLQLPALGHRLRARPGPARAPRRDARRRARGWRRLYGEALGGVEGLDLPCPDAGRRPAQLVRLRGAAAARRGPRRHGHRACASAASTPSPTCPRST